MQPNSNRTVQNNLSKVDGLKGFKVGGGGSIVRFKEDGPKGIIVVRFEEEFQNDLKWTAL